MKPIIETSDSNVSGRSVRYEFDLEKDGGIQGHIGVDMLGFTVGSIEVFCGSGTGASGDAKVMTSNSIGGAITQIGTIGFTEGDKTEWSDDDIRFRHLYLDLSSVTLGTTGRVQVIFIAKRR